MLKALPAWFHQPSSELTEVAEEIGAHNLSLILSDHRISSNKFRLVRQLHRLAEQHMDTREQFTKTDFWRLKEHIPSKEHLSREDIDSFASLLIANVGIIHSFRSEPSDPQTLRARHHRGTRHQEDTQAESLPQRAIIQSLLVIRAFSCPLGVSHSTIPGVSRTFWTNEYHAALEYFQHFPVASVVRPPCAIDGLNATIPNNPDFLQWICSITTF